MRFMIISITVLTAPLTLAHHEPYFSFSNIENIAFLLIMVSILLSTGSLVYQRISISNKKSLPLLKPDPSKRLRP